MNLVLTNLSPGVYGRNKQQVYASNIIKYNEGLTEIEIDERYPLSWLSSGSFDTINAVTGEKTSQTILIESLLNRTGIKYLFSNVISNFISFAPLGYLFVALIGISVFEKSGLLKTFSVAIEGKISDFFLTLIIITIGVVSSIIGDSGYVFLIPIAALLFAYRRRNPIGGIVAAFSGIAGGYGVNFLVGNLDFSLAKYSTEAAKLLAGKYSVSIYGNYYFMIVASIVIILVGTFITEKFLMPKFPVKKYDTDEFLIINKEEKMGLLFSGIATLIMILIFVYMIIPWGPYSGLLLDQNKATYIEKIFSSSSPFSNSIVLIISILLFVSGLFYSIGSKNIKDKNNFVSTIIFSTNNVGYLIVLMFFASLFISIFKYTNIGQLICVWLMNIIDVLNPSGIVLVIFAFIIFMVANIFLPSPILKWAIMSPTIIKLFTSSYISPEFVQIVYRTSTSVSNMITPLLAYYVIYLGYLQLYNNKEEVVTIKDSYKYIFPYFILFALTFLILVVIWYIINLPIGPSVLPIM